MKTTFLAASLVGVMTVSSLATEAMYEPTAPGVIEVKKLPERTALSSDGSGNYFENDDAVFMKLFRYIDSNKIAMTVPVESEIDGNTMRFFAGDDASKRTLTNSANVTVIKVPESRVASIGIRGSYTKESYETGLKALEKWLEDHKAEWRRTGKPYAAYWNSPFVPGIFKKSEIHIPVEAVAP